MLNHTALQGVREGRVLDSKPHDPSTISGRIESLRADRDQATEAHELDRAAKYARTLIGMGEGIPVAAENGGRE